MLKTLFVAFGIILSATALAQDIDLRKIDVMDAAKQGAANSANQYEIVKKHGTAKEQCNAAFMVTMSYLNANDEDNYLRWREVKRQDCQKAGLPANFGEH